MARAQTWSRCFAKRTETKSDLKRGQAIRALPRLKRTAFGAITRATVGTNRESRCERAPAKIIPRAANPRWRTERCCIGHFKLLGLAGNDWHTEEKWFTRFASFSERKWYDRMYDYRSRRKLLDFSRHNISRRHCFEKRQCWREKETNFKIPIRANIPVINEQEGVIS